MIEVLENKNFEEKPHEYIADMPRAICSALVEAGYRKADEVRKETRKETAKFIVDALVSYDQEGNIREIIEIIADIFCVKLKD